MLLRTLTLLTAALVVLLASPSLADPRTDADAAYGRGDFAAGLAIDRTSAANGDVRAMINLGDASVTGRGVEKDSSEGLHWYVAAAEAGSDLVGSMLGSPLEGSDDAQAILFNRRVALEIKADNDRMFPIVANPGRGDDVYDRAARARHAMNPDFETLRSNLVDATILESVPAMVSLAYLYEREIRPINPNEALRLYEKAAERGNIEGMFRLANMYFQVALNDDGLRWLRKAAEGGHLEATAQLAGIYEDGLLVPRDPREGFRLKLAAAEKGRIWSALHVAEAYHDGHGVERNFAKAAQWFQVAANDSRFSMDTFAAYDLALMYLDGRGVPQDRAKAIELLEAASAGGQAESMELLGTLKLLGVGTPPNPQEALRLYDGASKYGRTIGTYNLGVVYANGMVGAPDPALAETWFKKAASGGDAQAKDRLAGRLDRRIAPTDLLLPDQLRNGFTGARCIRTASSRGISPYQGPPDATLQLVSSRTENGMAVLEFVADATDPDGDPLTYRFASAQGDFIGNGNKVTLRSAEAEDYRVSVFVSDGRGCTMERWGTFTKPAAPAPEAPAPTRAADVVLEADPPGVRCARNGSLGEARVDTGQRNRAGSVTVEEVSAQVTPNGTLVTLHAKATDPDNDALTYFYSVLSGRIISMQGADMTWLVTEPGFSMASIEVSDGHGCTLFGSFSKEFGS